MPRLADPSPMISSVPSVTTTDLLTNPAQFAVFNAALSAHSTGVSRERLAELVDAACAYAEAMKALKEVDG